MKPTQTTERSSFLLADNPGMMTLDGTNTWILREPGAGRAVVVDPGPDLAEHVEAVVAAAGEVALVLFTHHHWDHTDALDRIVALTGAPTRAASVDFCRDAPALVDGEVIDVDGLQIEVMAAAGHTHDSTAFVVPGDGVLLSGDTILGRGTSIVTHPDGSLGDYLNTLARIRERITAGEVGMILPGHGPVITSPAEVVDFYLAHRQERLAQVRAAVEQGASTPRAVVELVYSDVDPSLWPAAEQSVAAQLEYLRTAR